MKYLKTGIFFTGMATTLLLSGCGGSGSSSAMIAGTVSGLTAGTSVGLLNNGKEAISVNSNGSFFFNGQVGIGTPYAVTVNVTPLGESCAVTNGTGIVGQYAADVSNIEVICAPVVGEIAGIVTGLAPGATLQLLDQSFFYNANVPNSLTITLNGQFVFPNIVQPNFAYAVSVSAQPVGQNCVVTNGNGTMPQQGNITSVLVTCH